MSVAFKPAQSLTQDDLKIIIRDVHGSLVDPFYIRYSLFDYTTGVEVLIGPPDRIPATSGIGQYYVNATIPADANIGDWLVRWNFRLTGTSPTIQVVQEFAIVATSTMVQSTPSDPFEAQVRRLRILLRDNNPDRNYRFRPPAHEKFLQAQTQVFGYIWEDYELQEYLLMAVQDFNSAPPVTGIDLTNMPQRWGPLITIRAAVYACMAMTANWISDEFNYSISGISLDLEKSSKYESLKSNFEQEWEKGRDLAKRSIKIITGLRQPRYGIGISSALGPYSRPGVQSRRNFISGFGA